MNNHTTCGYNYSCIHRTYFKCCVLKNLQVLVFLYHQILMEMLTIVLLREGA
jgi:hypothetical protein